MLTGNRKFHRRLGDQFRFPMSAGAVIYQGALVVLSAGFAEPGTTATDLVSVGIAETHQTNSGADGAAHIDVRRDGLFPFANKADDLITLADIGSQCYIVDDVTVARTSATNTRSIAGIVRDVEDDTVWIEFV